LDSPSNLAEKGDHVKEDELVAEIETDKVSPCIL
jgi:pyruvate/2-oxoglutarate dehydrogenase complex dihydrolipoamide acyltransferase (E2) component